MKIESFTAERINLKVVYSGRDKVTTSKVDTITDCNGFYCLLLHCGTHFLCRH